MSGPNQSVKMSRQELRKLADFREMAEAHIERLGAAIKARRTDLGWSRARLGREVSAHEKTVERWEKAQTAGALDNIETIAAALDMDGDALLAQTIAHKPTPDVMDQLSDNGRSELRAIGERLAQIEKDLGEVHRIAKEWLAERDAAFARQEQAQQHPQETEQPVEAKPKTGRS